MIWLLAEYRQLAEEDTATADRGGLVVFDDSPKIVCPANVSFHDPSFSHR